MGSGTAEIRTQVRRTPCAEDTATPRSRVSADAPSRIKPFAFRPSDQDPFEVDDDPLVGLGVAGECA